MISNGSPSTIRAAIDVVEWKKTTTEIEKGDDWENDDYGFCFDFENDDEIVVGYNDAEPQQPPPPISTIHINSDGSNNEEDCSVVSTVTTIPDDDDDGSPQRRQQKTKTKQSQKSPKPPKTTMRRNLSFGVPPVPNTTLVSLKGDEGLKDNDNEEEEETEECLKKSTSLVSFSELVKMEHVDNFRLSLRKGERHAVWYTDHEMTEMQFKVLAKQVRQKEKKEEEEKQRNKGEKKSGGGGEEKKKQKKSKRKSWMKLKKK